LSAAVSRPGEGDDGRGEGLPGLARVPEVRVTAEALRLPAA
jgi:hypothetical protein